MTSKQAVLWLFLAGGLLVGCAGFDPVPVGRTGLLRRAQSLTRDGIRVTVAVPTTAEARKIFDSKLGKKGSQPIWIEIETRPEEEAWFYTHSVDADYFPPLEVAWQSHRSYAKKTNRRIDAFFYRQAPPTRIAPGEVGSGFVFVNLDRGMKYVPVEVLTENRAHPFEFFIPVPGFPADYSSVDFDTLYPPGEIEDLETENELKVWAEALPACAANAKGTRTGDPINFILIAPDPVFDAGFLRTGWDETVALSSKTAIKTGTSAVFGKTYRNAPISHLYLFGRPQDIGLQKARRRIHQRNHLRLWLAPVTFRDTPVWVGQISRDIGSKFTTRSRTLTTHKIDPDVDDARDALTLDLIAAGVLSAFGYVSGVGAASPEAPQRNLAKDPFFTDGLRVLLFLSDGPIPYDEVRYLE